MKVLMYKKKFPILGWVERLGLYFNDSTIIDLNFLWELYFEKKGYSFPKDEAYKIAPPDLSLFLKTNQESIQRLEESTEIYKNLIRSGDDKTKNLSEISFDLKDDKDIKHSKPLSSINCYRDFYAHEKHVLKGFELRGESIPQQWYEYPVYYKSSTAGFIGPDEFIPWPSFTQKLDYELELAAIIGKKIRNTKAKEAHKGIFGFTILNDVSARDIQREEMRVRLGPSKGKDFCSVLGPVVITADEFNFEDPKLKMIARVNNQVWSSGFSNDAYYSWAEMIEFSSRDEDLFPTDLIGSGTVGTGCGLELNQWIKPGDLIELEIEKIGVLKNIVDVPKNYEAFNFKK